MNGVSSRLVRLEAIARLRPTGPSSAMVAATLARKLGDLGISADAVTARQRGYESRAAELADRLGITQSQLRDELRLRAGQGA